MVSVAARALETILADVEQLIRTPSLFNTCLWVRNGSISS